MNIENILINIIIPIILAQLCFKIYNKKIIMTGPNSNVIKKNIYKYNNKCYKLIPKIYICPKNTKHSK
jgi:hypothetical protein